MMDKKTNRCKLYGRFGILRKIQEKNNEMKSRSYRKLLFHLPVWFRLALFQTLYSKIASSDLYFS
jgi:hypothetical protein